MAENGARLLSHPFFCCIYCKQEIIFSLFFPMPDRLTGRWEESNSSVFNHKVCSALFRNFNLKGHTDVCAFSDYVHKTFMDVEQFGTILTRQAVSTWKLKVHILSCRVVFKVFVTGWLVADGLTILLWWNLIHTFECRNSIPFTIRFSDLKGTQQRFCLIQYLKLIERLIFWWTLFMVVFHILSQGCTIFFKQTCAVEIRDTWPLAVQKETYALRLWVRRTGWQGNLSLNPDKGICQEWMALLELGWWLNCDDDNGTNINSIVSF
jgi:hypothetical protein